MGDLGICGIAGKLLDLVINFANFRLLGEGMRTDGLSLENKFLIGFEELRVEMVDICDYIRIGFYSRIVESYD